MYAKEERETVCVYEEETDSWTLESSVRKHITRLTKIFGEERFDEKSEKDADGRYIYISIPNVDPSQVSFRNLVKPRVLSEEQKQAARERLAKARGNK